VASPDRDRQKINWRDHLAVHPAAELFPLMSEAELRELADDIKQNGLRASVAIRNEDGSLIDGRNRLDALALAGLLSVDDKGRLWIKCWNGITWFDDRRELKACIISGDPYAYALSVNAHRRHLTADQKRDLIAKVLKAKPDVSNRQIAKQVKADDKTVASVRRDLESTAEIPQLDKTVGADGKARKKRKLPKTVVVQMVEQPPQEPVKVRVRLANGEQLKSLDKLSDAAKQQIAAAVEADEQVDRPQDFWQRSLSNLAGDAISMRAFWTRQFGDWEKFDAPSDLVTLAQQAAEAWQEVAQELVGRLKQKAKQSKAAA
jgi:hypothetical protein